MRFNAQRKSAGDLFETRAAYSYAEDDSGDLNARNGDARIQYNYDLGDWLYVYVGSSLEYDRFKFLNLRSRGGGGFGVSVLEESWIEWRLEAGLTYVNEDLRDTSDERFTAGRLATTFWSDAVPDRVRFRQTLEFVPSLEDGDDFTFRSVSACSFDLWGGLGLGVSVVLEYDETPPPGAKHRTDTRYQAAVTWTF